MKHKFTVLHLYCGIGGCAIGTENAKVKIDTHSARFVNVGGIDIDPMACEDYERLTGTPALCADLHELTPAQLRAFCPECPDVVMASPPCKGMSGLLGAEKAKEEKYQKMNQLLLRAMFLVCSTWDRVPKILFFENVPRITSRGKAVIAESKKIAEAHGYIFAMGNHNCGEIGGLGQNRHRWFMVCRQPQDLPTSVYNPQKKRVRACGEVLDPLPVPGDTVAGGPMHSLPQLSLQNWVRLALIPPGGDWRDLPGVLIEGQKKREKFRRNVVGKWEEPHPPVTGPGGSAAENVADPRPAVWGGNTEVTTWDQPSPAVTANGRVNGSGAAAVADPRLLHGLPPSETRHNHKYRVEPWTEPSAAVISATHPGGGGASVADPILGRRAGSLHVQGWDGTARTITGADPTSQGGSIVADPIIVRRAEALGVMAWTDPAGVVTGEAYPSNGRFAVADPRFGHVDRVTPWSEPIGAVTHSPAPSSGAAAVADPRFTTTAEGSLVRTNGRAGHVPAPRFTLPPSSAFALSDNPGRHWNKFAVGTWTEPARTVIAAIQPDSGGQAVADPRFTNIDHVNKWDDPARTVTGARRPGGGAISVADPRFTEGKKKNWQQVSGVTPWTSASPTIISGAGLHAGAFQVADPRLALVEAALNCKPRNGAYKVLSWQEAAATITGSLSVDNGAAAVADPRVDFLSKLDPKKKLKFIPVIIAADGTWHRPLTTLELAVLQSLPAMWKGKPLVLAGTSHTRWREAIGNMVPPDAARSVGQQLLKALLSAAADVLNYEDTGRWVEDEVDEDGGRWIETDGGYIDLEDPAVWEVQ